MNRIRTYWLCQILGWLGMVAIEIINYTFFIYKRYDQRIFIYFLFTAFLGVIFTHFLKMGLKRVNLFTQSRLTIWLIALVCTFTVSFMMVIVDDMAFSLLYNNHVKVDFNFISLFGYIINWMRYVGVWVIIYFLYKTLVLNSTLLQEKLKVENDTKTAELELLKSQLNPHFLFNALNSIMALISINPQKSREAVLLLSDLLRFTLDYGKEKEIKIIDEVTETKKYLKLEQIRFGDKLVVIYQIEEAVRHVLIPPASILTLAENAIKHGGKDEDGLINIAISAKKTGNKINIMVTNTGIFNQSTDNNGIGLQIVKKRLEATYGTEGSFSIDGHGGWVHAIISIPAV